MSIIIERMKLMERRNVGKLQEGKGVKKNERSDWEEEYRKRWKKEKIVR